MVDHIINNINIILQTQFGLTQGLANTNVKLLDFATGTGTFLFSVYKNILSNNVMLNKNLIENHILKNIYGFELLIPAYCVAHLKLSQYLKENANYTLQQTQRIPVYLTNTLTNSTPTLDHVFPAIATEGTQAQQLKDSNILVITGNPPYNNKSKNNNAHILNLIKDYKKDLKEGSINSLSDDYVKFIRFAENKMETVDQGVVGIITNNSFLNGVVFRQMRKHLMQTFSSIYIINLHGNSNIGEGDKNVFDIKVGVSIAIFVKHNKKANTLATVNYYSTLQNGIINRQDKFNFLGNHTLNTINWQTLQPTQPYYSFTPFNNTAQTQYNSFTPLVSQQNPQDAIFKTYGSGVESGRDDFTIHFNKESLDNLKQTIANLSVEEIRTKYNLGADSRDWQVDKAKEDLLNNYNPQIINYRPFDYRYTSLSKNSKKFMRHPNYKTMQHFENKASIGLVFARQPNITSNCLNSICFITKFIIDKHTTGAQDYLAPLYTYQNDPLLGEFKQPNFSQNFLKMVNAKFNNPTPESILGYIYAVLHNTNYKTKYLDFLKMDFPRINFNVDLPTFNQLSTLGTNLINAHLMQHIPQLNIGQPSSTTPNNINYICEKATYNPNTKQLFFNNTSYFSNVPANVFSFTIGGYQVLDKYLKSYKNRDITTKLDDITNIINILQYTINTITEIDKIEV